MKFVVEEKSSPEHPFSWPEYRIEIGGITVAKAALTGCSNEKGFHGNVHDVWVCPKHRGQGLATRLMEHLMRDAKNMGFYKVELTCKTSLQKLYGIHGFLASSSCAMRCDL